jgi:hypothetical protein
MKGLIIVAWLLSWIILDAISQRIEEWMVDE